jgi:hypothetical protein
MKPTKQPTSQRINESTNQRINESANERPGQNTQRHTDAMRSEPEARNDPVDTRTSRRRNAAPTAPTRLPLQHDFGPQMNQLIRQTRIQ